ncbi:MAG: rod-binding protein [Sulfurimonas sp.]|uniref:rod-binding protein n=1 Tax=Sulfurimonas sp. TaxID=2022749 RepID=UPI002620547B|nr:rod-binding protein [Sulfurimonas sp.]MCW8896321.1 rod-binding protein [Sulfurimonas sp.]MCW8953884.1 rod-binding protein [Sulfurimonas sp.]MCW9068119.1 rod-binding protein [Sulfurimonas sp.]
MYGANSINMQAQFMSQQNQVPTIDANTDDAKLREQTDAFESVILKMLMDNAMKDEKNIFSAQNDPGDKIYKSMYRDELAKASAGGFGFSQMLYDYLSQKG